MLDFAAILLLLLMLAIVVAIFIAAGMWPGLVAFRRKHPYAEAIQIGGWITLICGGIFWPAVLIWAYAGGSEPPSAKQSSNIEG
jgi:hypothetical protein